MEVIKKYKSQERQFLSYVIQYKAGDVDYTDAPASDGPIASPLHARLCIDGESEIRVHSDDINQAGKRKVLMYPNVKMFSKIKGSTEWGMFPDQVKDYMVSDIFETEGNDVIVPMNFRIEDLRARIGNTKIPDNNGFVPNFMHDQRINRPTSHTYKNDCRVVCVTFVPRQETNEKDIEWKNGAWLQFADDGCKEITKKGNHFDYIIAAKNTNLMDGTRIVAGVAYKMDSGTIQIEQGTNIFLHIYD